MQPNLFTIILNVAITKYLYKNSLSVFFFSPRSQGHIYMKRGMLHWIGKHMGLILGPAPWIGKHMGLILGQAPPQGQAGYT